MPTVDDGLLEPGKPDRLLLTVQVMDAAVCLFQHAENELLLAAYDEDGSLDCAATFDGPGSMTVNDDDQWVLAGPLQAEEEVIEAWLPTGEQLSISTCPTAWLAVAPPLKHDVEATVRLRSSTGSRSTVRLRAGSPGGLDWPGREHDGGQQ